MTEKNNVLGSVLLCEASFLFIQQANIWHHQTTRRESLVFGQMCSFFTETPDDVIVITRYDGCVVVKNMCVWCCGNSHRVRYQISNRSVSVIYHAHSSTLCCHPRTVKACMMFSCSILYLSPCWRNTNWLSWCHSMAMRSMRGNKQYVIILLHRSYSAPSTSIFTTTSSISRIFKFLKNETMSTAVMFTRLPTADADSFMVVLPDEPVWLLSRMNLQGYNNQMHESVLQER